MVSEAAQAGYNAVQVNATNASDLKKLQGASTAISTGLFHFLPDPAAGMVLNALADAGFQTVVFNHGNLGGGEAGASVREQYSKLGITMHPRSIEQMTAIIPPQWRVEEALPQSEVLRNDPLIGPHVDQAENLTDVYWIVRV